MAHCDNYQYIADPIKLQQVLWPDDVLSLEQQQIVYSVEDNDETYVPAANEMGKDFITALIILLFFVRRKPCRVVTTSAKADHLIVLWGEINSWIQRSKHPLTSDKGGPLLVNHMLIRRVFRDGTMCAKSYVKGMVAGDESIASMGGHHASGADGLPRTLFVTDETSSVKDAYYTTAAGWFTRGLFIGNTWDCANFFKRHIKAGDVPRDPDDLSKGYHRKVLRIRAQDSPNVKLALAQQAAGLEPTGEMVVPGIKSWQKYQLHRKVWDKIHQTIALDAEFYEGAELLLFPPEWLNRAHEVHARRGPPLEDKWMGVDPGEGAANTSWAIVDRQGLLRLVSLKTADTSVIVGHTLALMREHGIPAHHVYFDRGGGGKQHVDRLRDLGHDVHTVGFGEKVSIDYGDNPHPDIKYDIHEEKYEFFNRRNQMYSDLSRLLDPSPVVQPDGSLKDPVGFGIPEEYGNLRSELAPIPKRYDEEGRLKLPPKHKRDAKDTRTTLVDLIGHSPDEADALVLAVYGMLQPEELPFFVATA